MSEVLIIFGSKSDTEKMRGAALALKELEISYSARILSAHRVPEKLEETVAAFEARGGKVIIAGAGLAAHLPGVVASRTCLPVIGVPINGAIGGLDALFSIVQMPKSIPVATVGLDISYNAGLLAAQILSVGNPVLREKLKAARLKIKEKFIAENTEGIDL
ncbi:MAG: 5-(carboxyamino)imidazole ribonucleotide mutase [Oscillospiraceae bacterium]|nr:5-(carboxyamino)imidazole ribonucleotide mutase [Oscillospiraceae bacterium]